MTDALITASHAFTSTGAVEVGFVPRCEPGAQGKSDT